MKFLNPRMVGIACLFMFILGGLSPSFSQEYKPDQALIAKYRAEHERLAAGFTGWAKSLRSEKPEQRIQLGHSGSVYSVAFSPDGRQALSGSRDNTVKLWEVATGKEIRTFTGHSSYVSSVAFSPDGRQALSGSHDSTVKLWEVSTGKEIRTFTGHSSYVPSVAFSPDGKYALSGSWDSTVKLWEVATGEEIRTFTGHSSSVQSVAFSPDGRHALSGSWDNTVKLWEVSTGEEIRTFTGHSHYVSSVAFSPDGRQALSGSEDSTVKLWEVSTGKEVRTFTGHSSSVYSAAFSPDGRQALSGSTDNTLKLWEVSTGKEIRTFTGHSSYVPSVAFSPDGRQALSGSKDKTVKLWEVATGKELRTFTGHSSSVSSVAFSPDGRHALSGSWDSTVKLWEVSTGKEIRTFTGHSSGVRSVAFSPDGRQALSGSYYKTLKLWEVATGKEIRTFTGHSHWVSSVAFSPDGRQALSGSEDSTMKLWNIDTGELIYTAIASPDGQSLVWTPEGYFAGDEELARKAVYIVDGLTTYSIDQFFDVFYRPDIIAAKASGEDISDVTGPSITELMRSDGSPPEVEFVTESGTSDSRDITLKMKVYDTGGGVGKVTVFLDGMPVTISDGRRGLKAVNKPTGESVKAAYAYEALVTLRYGANAIEVSAYNRSNTIESVKAAVELVYKQRTVTKPDLHILAVAINKYRDRALWLNYSVNDANAITEAIPQKARSLYRQVKVYKLYDNEVTEEKLNAQFDTIAGSVKPDDVFVFYLAGHGITNDTDGDYYYLPADFRYTGSEAIASGGISKSDILENLIKIPAQKTVLFFDTCNSGSFIDSPASRGLTEKTAVDRLKKAIGRAIIVASSESQVALEGMEDHGVFTYSLLRGLEGAADMNNDRFITLSELSVYIENDVPELTYEKWGYEQIPQKQLPKEDFPLVGQ